MSSVEWPPLGERAMMMARAPETVPTPNAAEQAALFLAGYLSGSYDAAGVGGQEPGNVTFPVGSVAERSLWILIRMQHEGPHPGLHTY